MDIITAKVQESQQEDMACIICGAPTRRRGVYVPKGINILGKAKEEGATRTAIYALCPNHREKDIMQQVEAILMSRNN